MKHWQSIVPVLVLVTGSISFLAGYNAGANAPPDPRIEAIHVLRQNAEITCKNHKDIIEEADALLRDNIDGLITPADMRKVVNDVVNRC